jgi:hypothetical protein
MKKQQSPKQQQNPTVTNISTIKEPSSVDKEISQLRAELRVFFEHLDARLDYIQKLQ